MAEETIYNSLIYIPDNTEFPDLSDREPDIIRKYEYNGNGQTVRETSSYYNHKNETEIIEYEYSEQ